MDLTISSIRSSFEEDVINKSQVVDWLSSDDLELRGFLYDRLTKPEYVEKIDPPLENEEVAKFVIRYSFDCIRENIYSDWADLPHIAGRQLTIWLDTWIAQLDVHKNWMKEFKAALSQTYSEGDESVRICIANSIIEPMLLDSRKSRILKNWESDAAIRDAVKYTESTMSR